MAKIAGDGRYDTRGRTCSNKYRHILKKNYFNRMARTILYPLYNVLGDGEDQYGCGLEQASSGGEQSKNGASCLLYGSSILATTRN